MCRLTAAVNLAFDLSIVLRRDRTLPPVKAGRRGQPGMTDELAVATDDFYRIDSLAEFLRDGPTVPLAAFHPHAEQTPFQALTLRRLGIAWPTVTSF